MTAALAVALMACDQFGSFERIGISLAPDGRTPIIHYLTCPGERILAVRLSEYEDESGSLSRTVLWEIRSATGSDIRSFLPGDTPPGFTEAVAFGGALPEDAALTAAIETNGEVGSVITFAVRDLKSGNVLTRKDGNVDQAAFEAAARDTCGQR